MEMVRVDELEEFWASIWDYCDVKAARKYDGVLAEQSMPGAKWFEGQGLIMLKMHYGMSKEERKRRFFFRSEHIRQQEVSWKELKKKK